MSRDMGQPRRTIRIMVAGVLVTSVGVAAAVAQSLGDIARQEEARRAAVSKPAKLYTNRSLRRVLPPTPAPATTPPPAAAAAAAPASDTAAPAAAAPVSTAANPDAAAAAASTPAPRTAAAPRPDVGDEAGWKQRISAAREALQRSQLFRDALQSRINALTADFSARSDPAQRAQIGTDRQTALAELDRVQHDIDEARKQVADIQEEARRSGVPAAWVR